MYNKTIMSNSFFVLLTILVGFCFPIMAASNGVLGKSLGSPFLATLAVFQLGSLFLIVIMMLLKSDIPTLHQIMKIDWKVWLGALIVILNLLTFTIVPSKIGIANMVVLFIVGQLVSAVLAEHFGLLNFTVHSINWQRSLGVFLLILGVILVKKF